MGSAVGWELGIEGMETFADVHQGIEIGFVGAVGGHCRKWNECVCYCMCRCGGRSRMTVRLPFNGGESNPSTNE